MIRRYGKYKRKRGSYRKRGYRRYRRKPYMYKTINTRANRSLIRLGTAFDLSFATGTVGLGNDSIWSSVQISWTTMNSSVDFEHYTGLYTSFIPLYMLIKWTPSIQGQTSGNVVPGVAESPGVYSYNLYDGFSTIRYDTNDTVLTNIEGAQYLSHKTFNPSRKWRLKVYPRKRQMARQRQFFVDYSGDGPIDVDDEIRAMGRAFIQVKFEATGIPVATGQAPSDIQVTQINSRLSRTGHFYVFYYMNAYDRN